MSTGLLIIARHVSRVTVWSRLPQLIVVEKRHRLSSPEVGHPPRSPSISLFPRKSLRLSSALARTVFCEVNVNFQPTLPEFDPQLNPIGYALAFELHGDSALNAITEDRLTDSEEIDRFGWEYNTAA